MRRNSLVMSLLTGAVVLIGLFPPGTKTAWAQTADVEIHLNGGSDVAYVGDTNIVEIWILNDQTLTTLSLGFEFNIGRNYEFDSLHGSFGYIDPHGDAATSFTMSGETALIDDSVTDSIIVFGTTMFPGSELPPHYSHELLYTLAVYIEPNQASLVDGFCVDNIFVPPAGDWIFIDSADQTNPYAPDFQGVPNTSPSNPDAPAICFDIFNPGRLTINEVRAYAMNGPSGDRYNAFVELYNADDLDCVLGGRHLYSEDGLLVSLPNWTMPPKTYLRIEFGSGIDDSDFSDTLGIYYTQGDSSGVLEEAYGEVGLYDNMGIRDFVCWSRLDALQKEMPYIDAISAGIWTDDDYVDLSNLGRFSSFGLCPSGVDRDTSSDWRYFDFTYLYLGNERFRNPIQRSPMSVAAVSVSSVLYWASVDVATSYLIEIDDDSTFASPELANTLTDTSQVVPVLTDEYYFWRVRVYDGPDLIEEHDVWEFYYGGGTQPDDRLLGVPHYIQHKDSRLLCITDDWPGPDEIVPPACVRPGCSELPGPQGPWDDEHPDDWEHVHACWHCACYCGPACIQMINHYYSDADNMTQDHIAYEIHHDNVWPGFPEGDLGHGRFAYRLPDETGPALSWALNAHVYYNITGPPSWQTIVDEIDGDRPIMAVVPHHWVVLDGYRVRAGRHQVHMLDPWPRYHLYWTGWLDLEWLVIRGYYRLEDYPVTARSEFQTVFSDEDDDGIMDFDEPMGGVPTFQPREFECKFESVDSDSDEVEDKKEILSYTFHDQPGHHPGHDNDPIWFPDLDLDGLRAEHDCDSDDDGDFDGGEDIDGDGHNPETTVGGPWERETCMYGLPDNDRFIKVNVEKDHYGKGDLVSIVDIWAPTPDDPKRVTYSYHANSEYHFEHGAGEPTKVDGDDIGNMGTFTTGNNGSAFPVPVPVMICPDLGGERIQPYYLYVDVLSDGKYSYPDNWDPYTKWYCETKEKESKERLKKKIVCEEAGGPNEFEKQYHSSRKIQLTDHYDGPFPEFSTSCDADSTTWICKWSGYEVGFGEEIDVGVEFGLTGTEILSGPEIRWLRDGVPVGNDLVDVGYEFWPWAYTDILEDVTYTLFNSTDQWFAVYDLEIGVSAAEVPLADMEYPLGEIGPIRPDPISLAPGESWDTTFTQADAPIYLMAQGYATGEMNGSYFVHHHEHLIMGGGSYACGDADGNHIVNISDAVYLISYIFGGGTAPEPLMSGDVDCNEIVNISDVVYLIAYIFGGGPEPCAACL